MSTMVINLKSGSLFCNGLALLSTAAIAYGTTSSPALADQNLQLISQQLAQNPGTQVVVPKLEQINGQWRPSQSEYLLVTVKRVRNGQLDFEYSQGTISGSGSMPVSLAISVGEARVRNLNVINDDGSIASRPNTGVSSSASQSQPTPSQTGAAASGPFSQQQIQTLLNAHNAYRQAVNVENLTWSPVLAASAQKWADKLASRNQFQHSQTRYGENLWKGTTGRFSLTRMVDSWGSEKQYFRYGSFPNVSTTGNWADVGHYTQVIWQDTTQVGCGIASGSGSDVLVCQYNPPGNYRGQRPY